MFPRAEPDQATLHAAAEWNVRLDRGELSDEERVQFHAWLAVPRNAREFDNQRALLASVQDLPPQLNADIERYTFAPQRTAVGRLLAHPWLLSNIAAAVVVAVLAGWAGLLRPTAEFLTHSYATATGEVRNITLPDGSVVYLNTQTRLRWIGRQHDRRVSLQSGEAFFDVVRDPLRPFRIALDRSEIRVLGTRFDVYRKSSGQVVVTVLSGTVAVEGGLLADARPMWQLQLQANDQIEYSPAGVLPQVRATVARNAVTWREGFLETEGEPLATVVGELGRYTTKRIVIADPRLDAVHIGGLFSVRDVPFALSRLEKVGPITVTRTDDAFILSYRPETLPASRPSEASQP